MPKIGNPSGVGFFILVDIISSVCMMITPLDFMIAMFQTNQYYLFVLF